TGSPSLRKIPQDMKDLVQCAGPARWDQQIYIARFRHKSPRIFLFPSHSHSDAMSGCSLPSNCRTEDVSPSYFPVENQTNPFAPSFRNHETSPPVQEVFAFVGRSASRRARNAWQFTTAARGRASIFGKDSDHRPSHKRAPISCATHPVVAT